MKLPELERHLQQTSSALTFVVALTSPVAAREMLAKASPGAIYEECRRAAAILAKLADDAAATNHDDAPLAAKAPLGELEASLKRGDFAAAQGLAMAALRALGMSVPTRRQIDARGRRYSSARERDRGTKSRSPSGKKKRT
ncbi:MAG TPA: hypothetical protein VIV60_24640 [Polyangiaceae bacterium]